MDYCEKVVALTGIRLFAIDREVNSEELARAFEDRKRGLICMLDANQYENLSDWDAECIGSLEDGSKVWSGPWKEPGNDNRHFVIVEKEDRLLPFWATPCAKKMAKPIDWPEIYRRRTEVQENSFKRMKEHGAFDVNFGTKTIFSEDRRQARKKETLEKSSAAIRGKIEKKESGIALQEGKVGESKEKGHGKRLSQRENKLAELRGELDGQDPLRVDSVLRCAAQRVGGERMPEAVRRGSAEDRVAERPRGDILADFFDRAPEGFPYVPVSQRQLCGPRDQKRVVVVFDQRPSCGQIIAELRQRPFRRRYEPVLSVFCFFDVDRAFVDAAIGKQQSQGLADPHSATSHGRYRSMRRQACQEAFRRPFDASGNSLQKKIDLLGAENERHEIPPFIKGDVPHGVFGHDFPPNQIPEENAGGESAWLAVFGLLARLALNRSKKRGVNDSSEASRADSQRSKRRSPLRVCFAERPDCSANETYSSSRLAGKLSNGFIEKHLSHQFRVDAKIVFR